MTLTRISDQEFATKVTQAKEPVVVDFTSPSCAPCQVLSPRLERVARRFQGRVSVYQLNIGTDQQTAQTYQVRSVPTLLVLVGGKPVERLDGLITDQRLEAAFTTAAGARGAAGAEVRTG